MQGRRRRTRQRPVREHSARLRWAVQVFKLQLPFVELLMYSIVDKQM